MRQRRVLTALAIPLVLAFVAASCGSDDSSSDASTAPGETESTEATEEETTEGTEAPVVAPEQVETSIVENTEEVVIGGSVTIGLEAEATGLRPWEDGCSEPCINIMNAIYDPLMEAQASGGYGPFLAESLESNADFTVWTMKLRPDITFHNGTPLTAQTIVDMFPIQQTGAQGGAAIAAATLTGVTAVDELTVDYTLSAPNSAFAAALATYQLGFPFDPVAAVADSAGYSINPIGTGPFVMKSRDIDNETVVERNPDYWRTDDNGNQMPYLDSISFRPIPDEGTRLDALLSGTVTAMQSLRQNTIRDARDAGGDIEIIEFQGNSTGAGHYNTLVPPLDDVRVRRGLNYMNNQEVVIEALGGAGISLPSTQFFSADDPYWTQEAADVYAAFDFDAGAASLQEYIDDPARSDGKAPGEKIDVELGCLPDPTLIAAMQVLEQVWAGSELVNVTLAQVDQATHINNAFADIHQAHCWRFGGQGDPSASVNGFVANAAESDNNVSNYDDPEMQAWAAEATATDDFETRSDLYSKIMVRINELALVWYSGGTAVMVAHEPIIKGVNSWTLPSGELGDGIAGASFRWHEVFVSE